MSFALPAAPIFIGGDLPASSAFFGGLDAGWGAHDLEDRLNHPTPATQFGIVLQGVFSITTTDGERRRFRPGDVFSVRGCLTLQGTHHCCGRSAWIPNVRPVSSVRSKTSSAAVLPLFTQMGVKPSQIAGSSACPGPMCGRCWRAMYRGEHGTVASAVRRGDGYVGS
jgi:hypothetical protein